LDQLIQLAFEIVGVVIGLIFGRRAERRHYARLAEAERALAHIRVTNLRRFPVLGEFDRAALVTGDVVIATDYYKTFATRIRNIFGGEMRAAASLHERARREAIVRLCAETARIGAHEVCNLRFEFISISDVRRGAMQVELIAYGTALTRRGGVERAVAPVT